LTLIPRGHRRHRKHKPRINPARVVSITRLQSGIPRELPAPILAPARRRRSHLDYSRGRYLPQHAGARGGWQPLFRIG